MVLELLLNLVKNVLFIVFNWIKLPQFPESLENSLNTFLNIMFQGINLLGFFIRPETLRIVIPLLIIIINFDKLYKLTMFILKKIPFLGIK